jgi:hypothetical protein
MRRFTAASTILALAVLAAIASGHPVKGAPKCPVFPKNNPWNQRVDKLPLTSNSSAMVRAMAEASTRTSDPASTRAPRSGSRS